MTAVPVGGDRRPKALLGQVMATAAVVLATYGLVTLVVIGRSDHFPEGALMFAVFAFGFGALGWLAIPRQPDNRAVWVPAWAGLFAGVSTAGWATAILIGDLAGLDVSPASLNSLTPSEVPLAAAISYQFVALGAIAAFFLMLTLWPLLFPSGELPSPRWRWVAWGAVTSIAAGTALLAWMFWPGSTVQYGARPEEVAGIGQLVDPLYLLLLVLSGICAVSLVVRHRRSTGDARQQYRWVGLGTGALLFSVVVIDPVPWQLLAALLAVVISVGSYGVAVTKYRLYDIDVVISRTVVLALLAGFITATYAVVVVGVGQVFGGESGGLLLPIVATALVAIAFEPVRFVAQRWANRLVYGKRATPYEVLSDFTERLASVEEGTGILSRMANLLRDGTGAERATVWLGTPGEMRPSATSPADAEVSAQVALEDDTVFAVHEGGEIVGALEVVKPRGSVLSTAERSLVADLAGSAGAVLGYQRLNDSLTQRARELEESRSRLVGVQDQERRRLERDLHEGAEQFIVALKVKIGVAAQMAGKREASELEKLLNGLANEAQATLDDIRSLAKGIYPPVLESEGLGVAISALASSAPVQVLVVRDNVSRYSADVEAAVYFDISEAVTNAVKHAKPPIRIALADRNGVLSFSVTDAGPGFDLEGGNVGSGLENMADRLDAIGGALTVESAAGEVTTIAGTIPVASSYV